MVNKNGNFGGLSDPLILNQVKAKIVEELTRNVNQFSRSYSDGREETDPRRNIDDECGYPSGNGITVWDYRKLYDRESVATRVVQVLPKESWQVQPSVFEDEDANNITAFEQSWNDLGRNFQGPSWHQDDEGSPIWEYMLRVDELSGIGTYGILLIGIDDGKPLSEPIAGFENGFPPEKDKKQKVQNLEDVEKKLAKKEEPNEKDTDSLRKEHLQKKEEETATKEAPKVETKHELIFLRAFDESLAPISQFENDKKNPRYGKPVMYEVTFDDPLQMQSGANAHGSATEQVHWSRVIHVADNLGSNETYGVPRMQPVYNRLYDLRKLYGGSAEMYWLAAFMGLSLETHPQLGPDVLIDAEDMKDQIEQFKNTLQRYMVTTGMTAKSLAPQVVDPTPQIEVALQAICILIATPKRVFVGSERGELASSEDKATWYARLSARQMFYLTPRLIVPFIDRLIQIGVLPEPTETGGYSVVWPDLNALTDAEKADIALKITEAFAKYVQGNVENVIAFSDYLQKVLGRTQEEAEAIIEAVMEQEDEDRLTTDQEAIAQEQFEESNRIAQEESDKGREFTAEEGDKGREFAKEEGGEGRKLAREGMKGKFEADAKKAKEKKK